MTNTRPYVACIVNQADSVPEKSHITEMISVINKGVRMILKSAGIGLTYGNLDEKSFHLRVYAYESFAANDYQSSQL